LIGTPSFAAEIARVDGKNIRIEFNGAMQNRLVAVVGTNFTWPEGSAESAQQGPPRGRGDRQCAVIQRESWF
jgi:hypothetical protein